MLDNEKTFKDAYQYCCQTSTRIPMQNELKDRQEDFEPSTGKRQKETFYLILKRISLGLIEIYQRYIRMILPSFCRFSPSCSEYTKQAILKYGLLKGVLKGTLRVLKCHPCSGKAGYDPLV